MAGQAANQIGAEKKCTGPPVTMVTDKEGRHCRAELEKREEGKERAAGKKAGPPSFVFRPSSSQHVKSNIQNINEKNKGRGEAGVGGVGLG